LVKLDIEKGKESALEKNECVGKGREQNLGIEGKADRKTRMGGVDLSRAKPRCRTAVYNSQSMLHYNRFSKINQVYEVLNSALFLILAFFLLLY
jgi:hypothetical protein